MATQPLVHRPTRLGHRQRIAAQRVFARPPGFETGGAPHRVVPVGRPHAVAVARTRGPRQHARRERDAQPLAQHAQMRFGRAQEIAGIDHQRNVAQPRVQKIEQPALLRQADVVGRHRRARFQIRGHDFGRVADQQDVAQAEYPLGVHIRQQMMIHVLLIPDRLAAGHRAEQGVGDAAPVGLACGDDLLAPRVIQSGRRQIGRIQRLVAHRAVLAVFPGAHHRRGDVARTAPHRDAQRCRRLRGHAKRSPARNAMSRAIRSRYSACSRVVIGPGSAGASSPMVRPSMLRTGASPAKVPVVNASSAE